jgi:hypothetical protein
MAKDDMKKDMSKEGSPSGMKQDMKKVSDILLQLTRAALPSGGAALLAVLHLENISTTSVTRSLPL